MVRRAGPAGPDGSTVGVGQAQVRIIWSGQVQAMNAKQVRSWPRAACSSLAGGEQRGAGNKKGLRLKCDWRHRG